MQTISLQLSPERKAVLKAEAYAHGLTVAEWLSQLAERSAAMRSSAARNPAACQSSLALVTPLRAVRIGE